MKVVIFRAMFFCCPRYYEIDEGCIPSVFNDTFQEESFSVQILAVEIINRIGFQGAKWTINDRFHFNANVLFLGSSLNYLEPLSTVKGIVNKQKNLIWHEIVTQWLLLNKGCSRPLVLVLKAHVVEDYQILIGNPKSWKNDNSTRNSCTLL